MTVEALLLLILSVFFIVGVYTKPGPTFKEYGPRLGARIENHLSTGTKFVTREGAPLKWNASPGPAPEGKFQ